MTNSIFKLITIAEAYIRPEKKIDTIRQNLDQTVPPRVCTLALGCLKKVTRNFLSKNATVCNINDIEPIINLQRKSMERFRSKRTARVQQFDYEYPQ